MSERARAADFLAHTVGVRAVPEQRVIRVWGDDARTWLSGQVTNDLRDARQGESVYALVLNGKGKIVADVHALDRGDDWLLLVPTQAADALLAHLEHYIIMEDVTLTPLDDLTVLTAQGPAARATVEAAAIPDAQIVACDRLGTGGVDVLVPAAHAEAALDSLARAARALGGDRIDDDAFALAALRLGRPRFGIDFGDRQYPQEAGLRERAVSFTKGCYLGQEVVCTLESRGQLVRKLVQLTSSSPLAAGATIRVDDGSELGTVTSVAFDPARGATLALGYVKRARAIVGEVVRIDDADATIARVLVADGG
jgi:folate-binding protein YgfZ